MCCSSVVLPEPDAPTIARNCRAGTDSDTPSRTGAPSPKRLVTFSKVITAVSSGMQGFSTGIGPN
jgi:hypothetical protein